MLVECLGSGRREGGLRGEKKRGGVTVVETVHIFLSRGDVFEVVIFVHVLVETFLGGRVLGKKKKNRTRTGEGSGRTCDAVELMVHVQRADVS